MTSSIDRPAAPYGRRGAEVWGSAIDASLSVLARLDHPVISFAMGSPAPDAIPSEAIARFAAEILAGSERAVAVDYAPTEGLPRLRAALLTWLSGREGAHVDPDGLVVTAGGMQGLDLVCRLFLDPGDLVVAESPSYASGLATLHNNGAEIVQVPLDDEGLDLVVARDLVDRAGRRPKLIYAIPTFQNPSGTTYSEARRRALLDLAREWNALVIEDDPYGELAYEGRPPTSLFELDGALGERVISVRTFSKVIAPGLRVGWVMAPRDTARRMVDLRQSMDTCANTLAQALIARMIETGELDAHIERLRALYPRRRDATIEALEEHVGHLRADGLRWTRPAGGMFLWLELPPGADGETVLQRGLENGVAIVPGSAFDRERCRSAVRLCFTAQDEQAIRTGVARLARTIRDVMAR